MSLIQTSVQRLLTLDLTKLKEEISLFQNEGDLWKVQGEISNSAGNLAIHLAGSLHHFVGAILGKNGYVRERDKEFSDKDIPRTEVLNRIDRAIEVINQVIPAISEEQLEEEFPHKTAGEPLNTGMFLIHLVRHVNYHLGQVNYLRRILK
ncbi:DinB family protein [Rapidithrix thailandica]|uniref:DinB family protein n=1 Tax=Rapidithrix thailandica TaxID=413964 RepID=A0AAW9RXS1_9BACT